MNEETKKALERTQLLAAVRSLFEPYEDLKYAVISTDDPISAWPEFLDAAETLRWRFVQAVTHGQTFEVVPSYESLTGREPAAVVEKAPAAFMLLFRRMALT